jgi:PTS system cellobiose-specific IIB component
MAQLRILLCCGGGISSGMLAQKGRKAAKNEGLDVTVDAKSESQVKDYLSKVDVLMVAPHYATAEQKFAELAKPYGVKVGVISNSTYGMLDGSALIKEAKKIIEK